MRFKQHNTHWKQILVTGSIIILLCVIIVPFRTQIVSRMQRNGFFPSYTERVYKIGDTTNHPVRYTPLGDSLTAGVGATNYRTSYPYLLAKRLQEQRGWGILLQPYAIPGATTDDALRLLVDKVIATKPDMVTILLGVNDVHKGVTPDTFTQNYDTILRRLKEETEATLYIIGIPHIGVDTLYTTEELTQLRARTVDFNHILIELAYAHSVPFIELYTSNNTHAKEAGFYAKDHFHPSSQGYSHWANTVYDALH